ncbi:hypothetical protein HDU76_009469 [Blyttiomyces sp. JEL0837]|nr:hypothetical protein HDU76_009469 [Blyttiomyces sp. JEL0837]
MKAIVVDRWLKDVNELKVSSVPDPTCPEDGVIIKIAAIGLNFFDILMVQGKYQTKPKFPFIPGAELAGTIIEKGPKVKGFEVGDRVFGTGAGTISCYAEKAAVKVVPGLLFKIPSGLNFAEAASLFMTYPTSWIGLVYRAKLQQGEVCLVHAAAGGVGIAAVQIAKTLGAIVIATAGSDEKCAIAKAEGADYTINYSTDKDWVATVNKITQQIPGHTKKGVDVIYDPVGTFIKDTGCIAWNGRILVVGFAGTGEAIEAVPSNRLLLKGASLVGVFWGGTTINEPSLVPPTWKGVFELFLKSRPDGKKWRPVVYTDKRYIGLESIPQALMDLGSRKTYGKVVVELTDSSSKL